MAVFNPRLRGSDSLKVFSLSLSFHVSHILPGLSQISPGLPYTPPARVYFGASAFHVPISSNYLLPVYREFAGAQVEFCDSWEGAAKWLWECWMERHGPMVRYRRTP